MLVVFLKVSEGRAFGSGRLSLSGDSFQASIQFFSPYRKTYNTIYVIPNQLIVVLLLFQSGTVTVLSPNSRNTRKIRPNDAQYQGPTEYYQNPIENVPDPAEDTKQSDFPLWLETGSTTFGMGCVQGS